MLFRHYVLNYRLQVVKSIESTTALAALFMTPWPGRTRSDKELASDPGEEGPEEEGPAGAGRPRIARPEGLKTVRKQHQSSNIIIMERLPVLRREGDPWVSASVWHSIQIAPKKKSRNFCWKKYWNFPPKVQRFHSSGRANPVKQEHVSNVLILFPAATWY